MNLPIRPSVARRAAVATVCVALLARACSSGGSAMERAVVQSPSASPTPATAAPGPTPGATGEPKPLCHLPVAVPSPGGPPATALPAAISTVARQVARIRGLAFDHPVDPQPVTQQEIGALVSDSLDQEFPAGLEARRSLAWATIGAVPSGTDLHRVFRDLGTSQVIGFYNEISKRLVFVGSGSPSPFERLTLSHELTHALDDQHFDLSRVDRLAARCRDDRTEAYLSLAEGDAVQTSVDWAGAELSPGELLQVQQQAQAVPTPPSTVPPFVLNLFTFPYPNGQAFVAALRARGGMAAVNAAFRSPPVSTEQILHPARYPRDQPQDVEVPDLAPSLGAGWKALDVQDVGEAWLALLLQLRLSEPESTRAAAGWGGGQYRAWAQGGHAAVLMVTTWDTPGDAAEFARAMRTWTRGGVAEVVPGGTRVSVLFASDGPTLRRLHAVAFRP